MRVPVSTGTLVRPYAFLATCWDAVGCSLARSEIMLTDLIFLCEVNLVLLVEQKLPLAGNKHMFFFLHRLIISPELCENISCSSVSHAQKSHP